jgi:hypothetical protein
MTFTLFPWPTMPTAPKIRRETWRSEAGLSESLVVLAEEIKPKVVVIKNRPLPILSAEGLTFALKIRHEVAVQQIAASSPI